jgi:hypothetical protein
MQALKANQVYKIKRGYSAFNDGTWLSLDNQTYYVYIFRVVNAKKNPVGNGIITFKVLNIEFEAPDSYSCKIQFVGSSGEIVERDVFILKKDLSLLKCTSSNLKNNATF